MKITKRPTMLMILDGFGISAKTEGNAIAQAKKPGLDAIFEKYPHTTLQACGPAVGLPEGQMGNSEVGHLNIGAGRVVYQHLLKISNAVEDGSFYENKALCAVCDHVIRNNSSLHLLGLLSDGGVHSHITHLFALLELAKKKGIDKVYIHCLLDGRDVPPRCAEEYVDELDAFSRVLGIGQIATVGGRYYGMDRDKRWDRVKKAYDAMVLREGRQAKNAFEAIDQAYANGENDEFVVPTCVCPEGFDTSEAAVKDCDGIIMFNFRPDRAREITRAFADPAFDGFERSVTPENVCYACMTEYDAEMPNVLVAFPPEHYKNTLGEYLSSLGLKQLRIAETEKCASCASRKRRNTRTSRFSSTAASRSRTPARTASLSLRLRSRHTTCSLR